MNYLIDTDILIDWLRGKKSTASFFREMKGVFYYSSITSLIAATAWVKKLILVTRNRKHFDTFDGAKPRFLNRGKKRCSVSTPAYRQAG
jgi:predicted nucleic acid-binding protein